MHPRWALLMGALAAVAWFFLGVPSIVFGVATIVVGLAASVLGIALARKARRGSSEWWMAIVGAVLGTVPLSLIALFVIGGIFGWIEFR
jgi:ABC-type uncharacterized transport system permease subunit